MTELELGANFATGSHLPSHFDVHRSLLTGKRIQVKERSLTFY